MTSVFEKALSGLRELGLKKLAELDDLCDGHQTWLASAVEDVKRQISERVPAAKKRRVGLNKAEPIAADPAQVCSMHCCDFAELDPPAS